jgi:hypothetical protein
LPAAGGDDSQHHSGERMVYVQEHVGIPILGKSLAWDGQGEMNVFGATVGNLWFLSNSFALGPQLSFDMYKTGSEDIFAGQVDAMMRWYWINSSDIGIFLEGSMGFLFADKPVPPPGTRANESFAFGPGADIPLSSDVDLLFGFDYHHISNARGRHTPVNPSQDDLRIWIGMGFRW